MYRLPPTTETSTIIFHGLEKGTSSGKQRVSLKKKFATRKMLGNITLRARREKFLILFVRQLWKIYYC